MRATAEQILAVLPQTQCTRCGYPDCAAYARAIAHEAAPINQCPPGGATGIERLAALTGMAVQPLNPEFGLEAPRTVAFIDENWCIGCTLCLDACPTDAIVGSNKLMHTVIEPYCTGCELCLPVCPVDCILLENVIGSETGWSAWSTEQANTARNRYQLHVQRIARSHANQDENHKKPELPPAVALQNNEPALDSKRAVIEAALARARERRTPGAG